MFIEGLNNEFAPEAQTPSYDQDIFDIGATGFTVQRGQGVLDEEEGG